MDTGRGSALVLGATGEIGAEIARRLVGLSSTLLLHGADPAAVGALRADLAVRDPRCRVVAVPADFASLRAAREVTRRAAATGALDVVVNAVDLPPPSSRTFTRDGNELTWQVNYLAPALIVLGLLPVLRRSCAGRAVHVLAGPAQIGVPKVADSTSCGRYYPAWSYVEAKLALMMLSQSVAARLTDSPCRSVVIQPALSWIGTMPVPLSRGLLVDAVLYACTSPSVPNGGCLRGRHAEALPGAATNPVAQQRMWRATCAALALDDGTGHPLLAAGARRSPVADDAVPRRRHPTDADGPADAATHRRSPGDGHPARGLGVRPRCAR